QALLREIEPSWSMRPKLSPRRQKMARHAHSTKGKASSEEKKSGLELKIKERGIIVRMYGRQL
ncbi:hypothetical protein, partial [Pseudomonas aeruginosa]|uniref:hypothetical protein n=1 Tax=Pseudomonas aeruginosa TaxID=287 RepID=UPI0030F2E319